MVCKTREVALSHLVKALNAFVKSVDIILQAIMAPETFCAILGQLSNELTVHQ